jgi:hypothetical protein
VLTSLFSWLRQSVRDSILAGCADAIAEIDGDAAHDTATPLAQLRARLTPALTHDEGKIKKGKVA